MTNKLIHRLQRFEQSGYKADQESRAVARILLAVACFFYANMTDSCLKSD